MRSFIRSLTLCPALLRRAGRRCASSREALSLMLLAGLPFVFAGSLFVNHTIAGPNPAYAYDARVAAMRPEDVIPGSADALRYVSYLKGRVVADPQRLQRLGAREVLMLLNRPGLIRTESDMAVWQYRNGQCVLDVYVTQPQGAESRARIIHHEIRARITNTGGAVRPMNTAGEKSCLKSLLKRHDGPAT